MHGPCFQVCVSFFNRVHYYENRPGLRERAFHDKVGKDLGLDCDPGYEGELKLDEFNDLVNKSPQNIWFKNNSSQGLIGYDLDLAALKIMP